MNDRGFSLAVDVGGTKTLIGVVDGRGEIVEEIEFATRVADGSDTHGEPGAESDLARVARRTREAALRHCAEREGSGAERPRLTTVAVGLPEYVSPRGLVGAVEVLSTTGQPSDLFAAEWAACGWPEVTTVIESDVRLGALGEAASGAGREHASFVYLSIGTGLSSSFVVGDEVWQGRRGEAIALGEWPVSSTRCSAAAAGFSGNLEQFASGAGIARRYAELGGAAAPTRMIADRAEHGDEVARHVLESAGTAVGRAAGMIVDLLDPAAIVVGGGLGASDGVYRRAVDVEFGRAVARRPDPPAVVTATHGPRSGLMGALAVVRRQGVGP
jgi:glucokinase